MDSPSENTSLSPEDRLDGWKRIAQFLNRDVRTVRRWEKNQGLPVRRVMHDKGATVFAYRPELEQWMDQRNQLALKPKPAGSQAEKQSRRAWIWPAVSVIAISALAWLWWAGEHAKSFSFSDQDWVLITQFDNRTGEDVLDGTLEYALERELNNSRFVKVIARNRVNDVLQLMQLPADTSIDIEIGRQISARDGDVSILITGRIDKVGDSYSLSASLVRPTDGVTLTSKSELAASQSDILPTVTRLALDVREALGEELAGIEAVESQLSRVTTPSLQALQLYSRADAMMSIPARRAQALPVLKQALRTDPDFASAHLLLHYLYKDRDDQDLARTHLEMAMALADTATERERLFILSTSHAYYPEEYEQAIEIGEILAGIYPDHFWAVSNLASLNQVLGRYDQVYQYRLRRADLRPNVGWANLEAVLASTVFNEPGVREPYLKRVQELGTDDIWLSGNLRMLPFYEAWLSGNLTESLVELEKIVHEEGMEAIVTNPVLSDRIGSAYLTLGKLGAFRHLYRLAGDNGWMAAVMEHDAGNASALDSYFQDAQGNYWDAMLMARAGKIELAENTIANPVPREQLSWPYYRPNFKHLAMGELALARNQADAAIEHLEYGIELLSAFSLAHYLFALNSLARAHIFNNDLDRSIEILERGSVELPWSIFEPGATYQWMKNQKLLISLFEKAGKQVGAKEKMAELERLLELADSNYPLLQGTD